MRPVGSKYLLEEAIGRGATGTVWRARQRETAGAEAAVAGQPGETVAIKVLKEELANDADVVMRFLRERSVLLRLTHPNIVRTRDLVVEGCRRGHVREEDASGPPMVAQHAYPRGPRTIPTRSQPCTFAPTADHSRSLPPGSWACCRWQVRRCHAALGV
uniref:protein kinase n=1 Tax=Streptomyces niveus TaxID=193462 RepID=UPI000A5A88CA